MGAGRTAARGDEPPAAGSKRLGADKVFYVTRCFRDETTTDAERLREFTQVGVEPLGANPSDCRKVVRRDAIRLFRELCGETGWILEDGVPRGLNLYDDASQTFEICADVTLRQLMGGGSYPEGIWLGSWA